MRKETINITCDRCEVEVESQDFPTAEGAGWARISNENGTYKDLCPSCVKSFNLWIKKEI